MITPEMLARSGTEHGEQAALFCWAGLPEVRAQYPCLEWMYAIANGGKRDKVTAGKLKAEGVKAGIADVFLPVAIRLPAPIGLTIPTLFCGLYIELKRADGYPSQFSAEQIDFAKFVKSYGYAWYPAFGWREATHIIVSYLRNVHPHLTEKQVAVLNRVHA